MEGYVVLFLLAIVIIAVAVKAAKPAPKDMLCINCLYSGKPKPKVRGSFAIELLLWLFFIVPGVIYTIWRVSGQPNICPSCAAPNMIPLDSPRARQLIEAKH